MSYNPITGETKTDMLDVFEYGAIIFGIVAGIIVASFGFLSFFGVV